MLGNEESNMTKRIKSSNLVKARKETKRLQREANTRIRKAIKTAKSNNDSLALEKIERIKKNFSNSLTSNNKSGLPKSFRNNVMREKGRAIQLKRLISKSDLSKKKQKRISRRTIEKLLGKEKTDALVKKVGGGQLTKMSNQFWEQMYQAQDRLYSMGIVPADEIMGKYGSIGSGLLSAGKQVVNEGYWANHKVDIIQDSHETDWESNDLIDELGITAPEQPNEIKVENKDLADAIVEWYKSKYGIE